MSLRSANLLLLAGFVIHNSDHARRGLDVTPDGVVWAGTFVAMLITAVSTLVFTDHELAPMASAAAGAAIAVGVSAAHFAPDWGPVSESYPDIGADWFSWLAASAEVAGAAVLGAVGFARWRAEAADLAIG